MDLVTRCREKLAYFRIKELKDVLGQMNQPKQGKKQDLVDRILSLVSDEPGVLRYAKRNSLGRDAVAKIIDDTYRKLQVHGAQDLASKSHSGSDFNTNSTHNHNHHNNHNNINNNNHLRPKEEIEDSSAPVFKVRCLCGSSCITGNSGITESRIKCEDQRCQVWQHLNCVIIPEKPIEGIQPELPPVFYCELCRLTRADPFWVTVSHPLQAYKFTSSGIAPDGSTALQTVERTFQLSRTDRELLQRTEYDLQVWCMLLNDKVQFRMQWPQFADLLINGISVRVIPRPGSQLLGINGRDDGPVITTLSREGLNKISLGRCDTRTFCFGIRVARKRSLHQVLDLIPKEGNGESFDEALARVKRCVGGESNDNDDSDSDLEVVAESVTVNLRCPMSGSRIRVAGRFKPCAHMACFDLDAFVELNQRSRKWQCPTCLKNYSLDKIVIDPYFNKITSMMRNCNEDVCEVEIKPDGSWRAKGESDDRDLARWHSSDGSLILPQQQPVSNQPATQTAANLVKQEATSENYTGLKLGIKRNRNGTWEIKKPLDPASNKRPLIPGNPIPGSGKPGNHFQRVLDMGSSSSDSDRDDPSVNQDNNLVHLSLNNGSEFNSFDPGYNNHNNNLMERAMPAQQPPPAQQSDVIVLSDTDDDENPMAYEPGPSGEPSSFPFTTVTNHASFPDRFAVDPVYSTGPTNLGPFSNNQDEFDINTLSMPVPAASYGFQFFGAESEAPDPLGLAPSNGYTLSPAGGGGLGAVSGDAQDFMRTAELASLVDNPLAFGDDPTLQIFLPTRPTGGATALEENNSERDGLGPDDWMSLSLAAGGARMEDDESALNSDFFAPPPAQQRTAKARMDHRSDDTSNVLLSMNGGNRGDESAFNNNTQRPTDYLFSHPRQPRSVRPTRNCLSIDTDSDSQ
ncbi:hypothetical protein LUZ60_003786 [Juncus effusus]|nr:hypothetical protein LUZ60_003786 [Juncus effusus]